MTRKLFLVAVLMAACEAQVEGAVAPKKTNLIPPPAGQIQVSPLPAAFFTSSPSPNSFPTPTPTPTFAPIEQATPAVAATPAPPVNSPVATGSNF